MRRKASASELTSVMSSSARVLYIPPLMTQSASNLGRLGSWVGELTV